MRTELLEVLRCPATSQRLHVEAAVTEGERIASGRLVSDDGQHHYQIRGCVPRFVPESNYADNFGMQWNAFRLTQLDSHSGQPISAKRFWKASGWRPEELKGQWVVDVGCGAGRFAEVALQAGARVIALDYSSAVDACYANLGGHPNLHVVQGDIYALPFSSRSFRFVYSLGVLQHTPNVAGAFAALPPMLAPNGRLVVDVYWKRLRSVLHAKYALRPITKRLQKPELFSALKRAVPALLATSQMLGRMPGVGRVLRRLVPVADYTGVYPLTQEQLKEWALLDTFDMLAPLYDSPQSSATLRRWLEGAGLSDVEVFHEGHLVGRGRRP